MDINEIALLFQTEMLLAISNFRKHVDSSANIANNISFMFTITQFSMF